MRLGKGSGKNFEDRTGMIIDKGYADTEGRQRREEMARHRQAKTQGENDEWVPLKYRNGYHRSKLGKVVGKK